MLGQNGINEGNIKDGKASKELEDVCANADNKNLCLPPSYSKFELPHMESVNIVEIGIDISDVLKINDKVSFTR